jgi:hypothetical protein
VAVIVGFTIGLTMRFLWWAGRSAVRAVIRHPFAALVLVLVAASQGVLPEELAMWLLLGLTLWGALSFASTRWPSPRRATPARSLVKVGNGPWQAAPPVRDPLDHVTAAERRRWERARRRHEKRRTKAGVR